MADSHQFWTTVGRVPAHARHDRVLQFEQELREQDVIRSLDGDDTWPSAHKPLFCGPDAKRFDTRLHHDGYLGDGYSRHVEKVVYKTVHLARKRIRRRGFSIEDLRQEALTMRKLDHEHVVKLVGAYSFRPRELFLLIWPAAVCNLSQLMDDIEDLRGYQSEGEPEDIHKRLEALDIEDLSAINPPPKAKDSGPRCPLKFLSRIIGCIAKALIYCHDNDVRHLDIKPSNILLKADRVYLADFGISRDVSGQDHTVTEGAPGTEGWRAPELYSDHGASMKLADIYSLGLVYLKVATILYNARLSDYNEAKKCYSYNQSYEEERRCREEKLKVHFDKLTAHALAMPPVKFKYDGQETVGPKPLVSIITRMLATDPSKRPSLLEIDEELSLLGGVHQIYHGHCCKAPVSWIEKTLDNKFAALISLQEENRLQRRRIEELEGKDQTYESRVENARRARDDEVNRLKSRLKEVEERCMKLEDEKALRRSSRRTAGTGLQTASRPGPTAVGLGLAKPQSTPATPAARPRMQPFSKSAQRSISDNSRQWPIHVAAAPSPAPSPLTSLRESTEAPGQRSPNLTSLAGYALRSRGSGSKLPLPVTPTRVGTPPLAREPSSTDSSMASSILSQLSLETLATPAQNSPVLTSASPREKDQVDPQWGALSHSPSIARGTRTSSSVVSSPRTRRSSFLPTPDDATMTARPIPSFKPAMSWAEVAMDQLPVARHPRQKRASHAAKT